MHIASVSCKHFELYFWQSESAGERPKETGQQQKHTHTLGEAEKEKWRKQQEGGRAWALSIFLLSLSGKKDDQPNKLNDLIWLCECCGLCVCMCVCHFHNFYRLCRVDGIFSTDDDNDDDDDWNNPKIFILRIRLFFAGLALNRPFNFGAALLLSQFSSNPVRRQSRSSEWIQRSRYLPFIFLIFFSHSHSLSRFFVHILIGMYSHFLR